MARRAKREPNGTSMPPPTRAANPKDASPTPPPPPPACAAPTSTSPNGWGLCLRIRRSQGCGSWKRPPARNEVSVKEFPVDEALVVNSLLASTTTDHGPCTFHEPEIPAPFRPKHPHCPGPALVRTQ